MSTGQEIQRIIQALSGLEGVRTVTRGWPKQEAALPCVAVQLAGERGVSRFDDAAYLTQVEYYVRCFARTYGELDALIQPIQGAMSVLGYERVFAWEESDALVHQRAERYQTTI